MRFPAPPIAKDVISHAVNPGRETGPPLKRTERCPHSAETFLRQVLGIFIAGTLTSEVGINPRVKQGDQFRGCGHIPRLGALAKFSSWIEHNPLLQD